MAGTILVSTAYLPPIEYFSLLNKSAVALIEKEENYTKQTYRNRCYILSANGRQMLTVPILEGSFHKTAIKDIRIDYSKRWNQVHLRGISASYRSSSYFDFYYDDIERIILNNHKFLLDLNFELLSFLMSALKINTEIKHTTHFEPPENNKNDYRYLINPKNQQLNNSMQYRQTFTFESGFVYGLSIIDLLFNMGPDAGLYL
jgi:predicted component of viral defense system (DUF524 family)